MKTLFIGRLFMKSGNVIPFAATKLKWKFNMDRITTVEYEFCRNKERNIGLVNGVIWEQVEAIVIDEETEKE